MNPFIAFCLYVAARVFVQYLKAHKDDLTVFSSLQFLIAAMQSLRGKNPLSESFLVQLDVDLEGSGLRIPATSGGQSSIPLQALSSKPMYLPVSADRTCVSIFDMSPNEERQQATDSGPKPPYISYATSHNSTNHLRVPSAQKLPYVGPSPDRSRDAQRAAAPDPSSGGIFSMYETTSGIIDMDVTFDNTSSQNFNCLPHSGDPTPSASPNNTSSHNSLSPPQPEGCSNLTSTSSLAGMSPNTASTSTVSTNNHAFPSFEPILPNLAKAPDPEESQNPFAIPTAWNQVHNRPPAENTTGDFELTGMNSDDVPSWQQMNMVGGNEWLFSDWNEANKPV
jgi:hypothetical protein